METILFMIVIYIVYVVFFKAKKEVNDDDEYQESKWKIINVYGSVPDGYKIFKSDVILKGTTHYMESFIPMVNNLKGKIDITSEPENKYDKNAIFLSFNDNKIGYIPKEIAKEMSEYLYLPKGTLSIRINKIGILKTKEAGLFDFDVLIKKSVDTDKNKEISKKFKEDGYTIEYFYNDK